jgi:CRISPR-associated protein Cmr5
MDQIAKPTLEQLRAAFAWRCVSRRSGEDKFQDYRNLAKSAPALVAANGLLSALLFFASKKGGAHERLLEDLAEWLGERRMPGKQSITDAKTRWLALVQASPAEYREASEEVLQVLRWIRQFAAAAGSSSNASQRP